MLLSILATASPACFAAEPEATGTVAIHLAGQAPSGNVYRLRDATITVAGPMSMTAWNTEDDPTRTSLSADVVVGPYNATLSPGWRMERVQGTSATTVPAELRVQNPVAFTVVEDQRTSVPFRFRVPGEDLDLTQGYDIVLEVEECSQAETVCGDGLDDDCDGAIDCSDSECTGAPGCAPCGNGVVEGAEECDDGNTANLDGCSSSCTLEPSEVEPNEDGSPSIGGFGIRGNDFATANADANGAFSSDVVLVGHLVPAGDEDVFAFENRSAHLLTTVRFDLWSSALGIGVPCGPGTIGTGLVLRNASGMVLAENDDRSGPVDRCSGLEYMLGPGQRVYAQVTDFADNDVIPSYVFTVTFSTTCGNGMLDYGEQCDDGNTIDGDGCNTVCLIEADPEVEPNNTFAEANANPLQVGASMAIQGSVTKLVDRDMFRVTVPVTGNVQFATYSSYDLDCQGSFFVRLYNAAGIELGTGGNPMFPCGSLGAYVQAGTYFIEVEAFGASDAATSYLLFINYVGIPFAEPELPADLGTHRRRSR